MSIKKQGGEKPCMVYYLSKKKGDVSGYMHACFYSWNGVISYNFLKLPIDI